MSLVKPLGSGQPHLMPSTKFTILGDGFGTPYLSPSERSINMKRFDYLSYFGDEPKTLTPEEMTAKINELEQQHSKLIEENATLKKTNEDLQAKVNSYKITGLTKQVDTSVKEEKEEPVSFDFTI